MSGFGVQSADVDMSWQGVSYRRIPGNVSVGMWRLYVGFSALDGIVSFLRGYVFCDSDIVMMAMVLFLCICVLFSLSISAFV